jgi:glycosyltransferase involved in cell wall biosynthesis
MKDRRVALIHDFLLDVRGAERVFAALCDLYPEADLFTAIYDEKGTEGWFSHRNVTTSFLQKLRPNAKTFRPLLPLYPYAMEALDLSSYDVVVSSSSAWAHGVLVGPEAVHVCYCHNPFRYAWNAREATLTHRDPITRAALSVILSRWRTWDALAAQRVDRYIANSETTRRRIARYFNRESSVLHPPVETSRFTPRQDVGEAYVVLSELMPHKRIDLAVQAFTRLGLPLVVIGNGPDERRLKRLAGPTISFAGRVTDWQVADHLERCRALVDTATEEFGIDAVEAQAAGRPDIALRDGGVQETVLDGITGTFFDEPTVDSLVDAVRSFDTLGVDPAECARNAERFDVAHFQHGMARVVDDALAGERAPRETVRRRLRRGLAAAG